MNSERYDFLCDEEYTISMFSKRLKMIRTKSEMTQQQFANTFGISVAALSYYETGKRIPDIAFLAKLKEYFDVPLDYFLGFTNSTTKENINITNSTHLSEKALNKVSHYISDSQCSFDPDYDCDDILNKILESEDFYKVLDILTYGSTGLNILYPDIEYLYFYAAREMLNIFKEIIENHRDKIKHKAMEEQFLSHNLTKGEKKDFFEWVRDKTRNEIREFLAEQDTFRKELDEQWDSYLNEYKNTERFKRLSKLKEVNNNGKHNPTQE